MSNGKLLSERQLRERVIQLIQRERGRISANASTRQIADEFGLELLYDILPIGEEGAYVERDAKIILSRDITSDERLNFTFYHELVHHLIRRDDDLYSDLHEIYLDDGHFDDAIEIFCNIGAAELILPRDCVRVSMARDGFSVNLVTKLCSEYNVSGPAALIQLVHYAPNRCFGVVCEYGHSPIMQQHSQGEFSRGIQASNLFILYAVVSPTLPYSLARWTIIPKKHLLSEVYETKDYAKGIARIPFRSGSKWSVPCQALFFRGNVYGLFHVDPPPSHQQLTLL